MCTVSWVHDGDGYQLFCNRDEKRTRAQATPPRIGTRDGVRFIAPADGDFGGSWIGANQFGVSVCLLNGNGSRAASHRSRGLLLLDLMTSHSVDDAAERASNNDLSVYAPFTIVALEPHRPAAVLEWDGVQLSVVLDGDRCVPLTSSSFDTREVCARRRLEFERLVQRLGKLDATVLNAFHYSVGQAPDAYSTFMQRPDARTVSFSRVKVSDAQIDFYYDGLESHALTITAHCSSHLCQ